MARLEARGICQGIWAFLVQITRSSVQRQLCSAITKNYCTRWLPGPAGEGAGAPGSLAHSWAAEATVRRTTLSAGTQGNCNSPALPRSESPAATCPPNARALQAHGMCWQKRVPGLCELHEFCQPREKPFLRGPSC